MGIQKFYMNDDQFAEFKQNGKINSAGLGERKDNSTNFVATMEFDLQKNGEILLTNSFLIWVPGLLERQLTDTQIKAEITSLEIVGGPQHQSRHATDPSQHGLFGMG